MWYFRIPPGPQQTGTNYLPQTGLISYSPYLVQLERLLTSYNTTTGWAIISIRALFV